MTDEQRLDLMLYLWKRWWLVMLVAFILRTVVGEG